MPKLANLVKSVRSKNAGPFWITCDIFCHDKKSFHDLCRRINTGTVAKILSVDESVCRRFEIESLAVLKFSMPRQVIQGDLHDRDMHGAAMANLILEYDV